MVTGVLDSAHIPPFSRVADIMESVKYCAAGLPWMNHRIMMENLYHCIGPVVYALSKKSLSQTSKKFDSNFNLLANAIEFDCLSKWNKECRPRSWISDDCICTQAVAQLLELYLEMVD